MTKSLTSVRTTRLENGVMVATERMPGLRSASLGLFLDIGSRDEAARTNGLAHLFEHMVFKGTPKSSPLELVQRFESQGGQINAYTSKEQTCFYGKVVETEVKRGLSTLLEMLTQSHFDPEELRKEKDVIVEEIRGAHDNPEDYVYDLFSEALFGKHTLGWPIAGTPKTVRGLTRDDLILHQDKVTSKLPMLVAAAGAVDHEEVVEITRQAFRRRRAGKLLRSGPDAKTSNLVRVTPERPEGTYAPKERIDRRRVQQATVMMGGPGMSYQNPKRLALVLANSVVGDGMSSRLFQSVREDLGLVYSIYSGTEFHLGAGTFSVGFGTDPGNLDKAFKETSKQLARLRKEGVTRKELEFAKRNLRGSLLMGLESTHSRMANLARQVLYGKDNEDVDHVLARLLRISLKDVNASLREVLDSKRWAVAAVAPQKATLKLSSALAF